MRQTFMFSATLSLTAGMRDRREAKMERHHQHSIIGAQQ
jgi:hypothetical protein